MLINPHVASGFIDSLQFISKLHKLLHRVVLVLLRKSLIIFLRSKTLKIGFNFALSISSLNIYITIHLKNSTFRNSFFIHKLLANTYMKLTESAMVHILYIDLKPQLMNIATLWDRCDYISQGRKLRHRKFT